MRTWTLVAALAAATLASACNLPAADKESDTIARAFYDEVRHGADLTHDSHVSPALETDLSQAALAQVRAMIPAGRTKVSNTGWNYATSTGAGSTAQLDHAYQYAGRTINVQTVMLKAPGAATWTIVGFEAEQDGAASGPIIVGVQPKSASNLD